MATGSNGETECFCLLLKKRKGKEKGREEILLSGNVWLACGPRRDMVLIREDI
jgi:hypothetical protein